MIKLSYIDDNILEEVREKIDIVELINQYLPLKKSGANYVGLCPFHSEKTPSFSVSHKNQFFHCFGCGAGGDIFEFIMKRENLNFQESIKFLADKAGVELKEASQEDITRQEQRKRYFEINRESAKYFLNNLMKNRQARNYLENRKISYGLARKFGLGYAEDSWEDLYNHLRSKGYKDQEMEDLGLVGKRKNGKGYYDKFRNRLIFPIIDTKSRVIGFGGRVLDDSMPKYLNSKETLVFNKGNNLYGLNMLDKYSNRESIILVEGYMDVISLFKNGIYSGVASLGTALTSMQAKLLKRYGEKVYICYDSDLAGVKATNKAIEILLAEDIKPYIVSLGTSKDPDEYFTNHTKKDFLKVMEEALNFMDFKIKVNKDRYDLGDIDGKIAFTKEISKELRLLKNPIEQDVYIKKLSKDLNIDEDAIKTEVTRAKTLKKTYVNKEKTYIKPKVDQLQRADLTAEIELIKLMVLDKDYYDLIEAMEIFSYFQNETCIEIIKIIKNIYKLEDYLEKRRIYDIMQSGSNLDRGIVTQILEDEVTYASNNISKAIEDLVCTLKINKLDSRRVFVSNKIKEIDKEENIDYEKSKELLDELLRLNSELDKLRNKDRG